MYPYLMEEKDFLLQTKKDISKLIMDVLAEKTSVQEAIKCFPQNISDESTECAFHALLHYEADEDYRKYDAEYTEEQKDYLEYIANLFNQGEILPANIIEEYKKYYKTAPLKSKKGIIYILRNLFRFII